MSLDDLLDALAARIAPIVADHVAQRLAGSAPAPARGYLSTAEVAERLGKTVDTVAEWCAKGRIPAVRLPGGREWRIRPDALEAALAQSTGGTSARASARPGAPSEVEPDRPPVDLRAARLAAAVRGTK